MGILGFDFLFDGGFFFGCVILIVGIVGSVKIIFVF